MILGIQMDVKTFSLQKESRFTSKRRQHMDDDDFNKLPEREILFKSSTYS